ncbi:porin family protein [Allomuricauda sp. d1]|uniref:porin family protein n=1 Tax=Allomuricauda sp. d1 TaxID=3136725 RepID=UPI0031DF7CB5
MGRTILFIFGCCFGHLMVAQVYDESELVGTKYLEDQFYTAIGYNILLNEPEVVVQRNLSYNLQLGFIKDMPLNQRRNVALGLGLGYATNSYYTNLRASETAQGVTYEVADEEGFKRSKFETHALEVPFEFRWRTSTATTYKFWRIYTGFKMAYIFSRRSKFVAENVDNSFQNEDIQNLQYGLMLNFGYNTFNIHAYYSLNPLLEKGTVLQDGTTIDDLRTLRVGVIFYIL